MNVENFISSDEYKVYLWDINQTKEIFNVISLDSSDETLEKITTSSFSPYNPSLFAYGTTKGNLRYCDLRVNSQVSNSAVTYRDENSNLVRTIFANQLLQIHDINFKLSNDYLMATRTYLSVNLWDQRKTNEPLFKFMLYEPIINKLSHLYQNDYFKDKFSLSNDAEGKFLLTGGYNNMFHIIDTEQRLNSQIVLDDSNEKSLNTNIIRKVNSKGSCFYKKDEPDMGTFNFDKKITSVALSPVENFSMLACLNCIYTYHGSITKSK
jgi:serine/threonine-protein phosphatase 2A regulatory subunit B